MPCSFGSDSPICMQRRHALLAAMSAACSGLLLPLAPALAQARTATRNATTKGRYPLLPGQYYWLPQIAPTGPVVTVVNLHTQMVQVFRNGVAIGFASSSTGKPGYSTPTGLFPVLEKRRSHRSSTYNNAPMPWMVRLTWSGVAFHAGKLPGYPASHGCIRLPGQFAPLFFTTVGYGDTVWITLNTLPSQTSPMTTLAPVTPDGQPLLPPESLDQTEYWNTSINTTNNALPLSVLASLSQQRLYVLHQGQLLASSTLPNDVQGIQLDGGALFEWQAAPTMPAASNDTISGQWVAHDANAAQSGNQLLQRVLPPDAAFTQQLTRLLTHGSRLFISHLPAINDLHWATPQ